MDISDRGDEHGEVVAVRGNVVDVRFAPAPPARNRKLTVGGKPRIALEVQTHISDSIVRCIPAIDPLQTESKMLTPSIVGKRHYRVAQDARTQTDPKTRA